MLATAKRSAPASLPQLRLNVCPPANRAVYRFPEKVRFTRTRQMVSLGKWSSFGSFLGLFYLWSPKGPAYYPVPPAGPPSWWRQLQLSRTRLSLGLLGGLALLPIRGTSPPPPPPKVLCNFLEPLEDVVSVLSLSHFYPGDLDLAAVPSGYALLYIHYTSRARTRGATYTQGKGGREKRKSPILSSCLSLAERVSE